MAAAPPRTPVRIALDWTPNTNHGGLALAIQRGWFADAGLDVELLSPHADGYKATPASRLASGEAHFACAPSETVISWATWPGGDKPRIKAVATLLQDSAHGAGPGAARRAPGPGARPPASTGRGGAPAPPQPPPSPPRAAPSLRSHRDAQVERHRQARALWRGDVRREQAQNRSERPRRKTAAAPATAAGPGPKHLSSSTCATPADPCTSPPAPTTRSPKQLDGKTYGSYGARYEGRIVQEVIRKDGGAGDYKEVTPPMLEIWEQFLKVRAGGVGWGSPGAGRQRSDRGSASRLWPSLQRARLPGSYPHTLVYLSAARRRARLTRRGCSCRGRASSRGATVRRRAPGRRRSGLARAAPGPPAAPAAPSPGTPPTRTVNNPTPACCLCQASS
jgi:hypothetical protein